MKTPKHALLYDATDHLWGVARLRNPCLLVKMHCLNPDGGLIGIREPQVWPPDALALTTEGKFNNAMTKVWRYYEAFGDEDHAEPLMYVIEPTLALPCWLFVDDEDADFSGLLDTENAVLWSIDDTYTSLTACLDWQMHPSLKPKIEFPASTREVADVWRRWRAAEQELEDEDEDI